ERSIWRGLRALLEVEVRVLVAAAGDVAAREGQDGRDLGIRPSDRLLERLELHVPHQRSFVGVTSHDHETHYTQQRTRHGQSSCSDRLPPALLLMMHMHHIEHVQGMEICHDEGSSGYARAERRRGRAPSWLDDRV